MTTDDMHAFIGQYEFKPVKGEYRPLIFGEGDLQKERPFGKLTSGYFYLMKSSGKVHCNYLVDTTRRILWASISYPDWGGN
jgi:hypothetical protein